MPHSVLCAHCHLSPEKASKCGRCGSTYYCNRTCQKLDWPQHKQVCNPAMNSSSRKWAIKIVNGLIDNDPAFCYTLSIADAEVKSLEYSHMDENRLGACPVVVVDDTVAPCEYWINAYSSVKTQVKHGHGLIVSMYRKGNFPIVLLKNDDDGAISVHIIEHY